MRTLMESPARSTGSIPPESAYPRLRLSRGDWSPCAGSRAGEGHFCALQCRVVALGRCQIDGAPRAGVPRCACPLLSALRCSVFPSFWVPFARADVSHSIRGHSPQRTGGADCSLVGEEIERVSLLTQLENAWRAKETV